MRALFTNQKLMLAAGQAVSGVAGRAATLRIVSGRVWITVEGIDQDYFLHGGDSFTAAPGRLVVVEAEQDARLEQQRQPGLQQLAGIGRLFARLLGRLPVAGAVQRRQPGCCTQGGLN